MLCRLCELSARLISRPRAFIAYTSRLQTFRLLSSEHDGPRSVHVPRPAGTEPDKKEGSKGAVHSEQVKSPGPPVTFDSMPVPSQKFDTVYKNLQSKFNVYLAVGVSLLALSLYLAVREDVFILDALRPPVSYRERRKDSPFEESSSKAVEAKEVERKENSTVSDQSSTSVTVPPTQELPRSASPSSQPKPIREAMPIVVEKLKSDEPKSKAPKKDAVEKQQARPAQLPVYSKIPQQIPHLLIGAGTGAYYAALAIRARDADAKVLMIGEEYHFPYNRPPLSKELWWYGDGKVSDSLEYKGVSGRKRDVFYEAEGFYLRPEAVEEAEHGGVAIVLGHRVVKLDVLNHVAYLDDGTKIKYQKCLIATGGIPRNLPAVEKAGDKVGKKVTLFRTIEDFRNLDERAKTCRSITIIGGGFLGSELAYSLNKRYAKNGLKVNQIFHEKGNIAHVLPEFLSEYTSNELRKSGVNVLSGMTVAEISLDDHDCVRIALDSGEVLHTDHVVVALGIEANTELAKSAGLEVDQRNGGFIVDAELRARSDVWVVGDASSFYDVKLGRRRVEHWEHAQVTGRLAGENMTGGSRPYWHQSAYFSLVAPDAHFQAVGKTDSSMPTVSVFAADGEKSEKPTRGVVFYMDGRTVAGVLLYNVFGSGVDVARKIITDGREHEDLREVAKLFELHRISSEEVEQDSE